MKRILTTLVLAAALMLTLAPAAQADDHDLTGVSVQIDNTIESVAFDFPEETPFGSQGPTAIGPGIEFAECCDGFYEIDFAGDQFSMRWIGDPQFARVIEDGTYDRYYINFDEPVLAGAAVASSSTLPATVTVASTTQLIVEIGPGMEVGDGFDATINLTIADGGPTELATTGVDSWQLAIIGATVVLAGMAFVAASRNQLQLAHAGSSSKREGNR